MKEEAPADARAQDRPVRYLERSCRPKPRAGVRRLRIPEVLQPLLARLAVLKEPNDFQFGPKANRWWLRSAVRRICSVAQTPVVSPHGLRGTHATLAGRTESLGLRKFRSGSAGNRDAA